VIWITGLSGVGKSSIAAQLAKSMGAEGVHPVVLDGDGLRSVLGREGDGYDSPSRRRLAGIYSRLCRLLASQGHVVICATIALFHEVHLWNRAHLPGYFEVFVAVPLEELRRRDTKGVYDRARRDAVGLAVSAEYPLRPDLTIANHGSMTPEAAADEILRGWSREERRSEADVRPGAGR